VFRTVPRNGDVISGAFQYIGARPDPGVHTREMTLTISGGTGRYEHATGSRVALNGRGRN
jgi:hypothetical protein